MRASKIKKDAKVIEKWVETRAGLRHASHPSITHGRYTKANRTTQFGNCVVYRGVERLGVLYADVDTNVGTVLDSWDLNPAAIGAVLPIYSEPYAKFLFRRVKLHQLNEISFVLPQNTGSVYVGANFDPTANLPVGNGGVDAMAAWFHNHMVTPLNQRNGHLTLDLKLEGQIPLFIERTGEANTESQGKLIALSGTVLNAAGTDTLAIGELFIEFEVEFYEMNPAAGDIDRGSLLMGATGVPSGSYMASYFNTFLGDPNVVFPTTLGGAGTIMLLHDGVYNFDISCVALGGTQNAITQGPVVALAQDGDDSKPCTSIVSCMWSSTVVGNGPGGWSNEGLTTGSVPATASGSRYVDYTGSSGTYVGKQSAFASFSVNASQGTNLWLISPTITTASGSALFDVKITVTRVASSYFIGGVVPFRTQSTFFTTLAQKRLLRKSLQKYERTISVADQNKTKLKIMEWLAAEGSKDPGFANALIEALGLPYPKFATTTMFWAAAAELVAKAVMVFGPILAQKAIDWIGSKIKEHDKKRN